MEKVIRSTAVAVSDGGDGRIMLCPYQAKKAIVVPREGARREHLGGNEAAFCGRLAAEEQTDLTREAELRAFLDCADARPSVGSRGRTQLEESVCHFEGPVAPPHNEPAEGWQSRRR